MQKEFFSILSLSPFRSAICWWKYKYAVYACELNRAHNVQAGLEAGLYGRVFFLQYKNISTMKTTTSRNISLKADKYWVKS